MFIALGFTLFPTVLFQTMWILRLWILLSLFYAYIRYVCVCLWTSKLQAYTKKHVPSFIPSLQNSQQWSPKWSMIFSWHILLLFYFWNWDLFQFLPWNLCEHPVMCQRYLTSWWETFKTDVIKEICLKMYSQAGEGSS